MLAPRALTGQSVSTRSVANADIPIVQIDGGIAVAGNEPDLFAESQPLCMGTELQLPMLVRDARYFHGGTTMHPRRTALGAVGFESGIDDGAVRRRHADHGREYEQTVLEFRVAAAIAAADARVLRVHENI